MIKLELWLTLTTLQGDSTVISDVCLMRIFMDFLSPPESPQGLWFNITYNCWAIQQPPHSFLNLLTLSWTKLKLTRIASQKNRIVA